MLLLQRNASLAIIAITRHNWYSYFMSRESPIDSEYYGRVLGIRMQYPHNIRILYWLYRVFNIDLALELYGLKCNNIFFFNFSRYPIDSILCNWISAYNKTSKLIRFLFELILLKSWVFYTLFAHKNRIILIVLIDTRLLTR